MNTRLTIFTATLVQDSALSISGLDRESTSDQPFTVVDGKPVLSGRGLKGAAVAMARRFFYPLPRAVSEIGPQKELRRSAWLFRNAEHKAGNETPRLRSGVGILQATGARADGVLYDREVMPAGTKWELDLRVDWRLVGNDEQAAEVEGILGYVLDKHWKEGRCWLGGGAARGLGFCHLTELKAYRIDDTQYEKWVKSGRKPGKEYELQTEFPHCAPTKSWFFRTLDVDVSFGAYRPTDSDSDWGVDMLAIGPHEFEQGSQRSGTGSWARPSWAQDAALPADEPARKVEQLTDRAILMDGDAPLIPGSSIRGPLRHAFSQAHRRKGGPSTIQDPHDAQGKVGKLDAAGELFGMVEQSSALLIRDATAQGDWSAARLHMHAEDEFSAGSYGTAKRDAVRLLQGTFAVRFVIEGGEKSEVERKQKDLDRLIALGKIGHLPIGGHKTKGAGFGQWKPLGWQLVDVPKPKLTPPVSRADEDKKAQPSPPVSRTDEDKKAQPFPEPRASEKTWIQITAPATDKSWPSGSAVLTLKDICANLPSQVKDHLTAWWCEPAIDFSVSRPQTFGRSLPIDSALRVEEAVFFAPAAVFRIARTKGRWKMVLLNECEQQSEGAKQVSVSEIPARLHGDTKRFAASLTKSEVLRVKEWRHQGQTEGFTLIEGSK